MSAQAIFEAAAMPLRGVGRAGRRDAVIAGRYGGDEPTPSEGKLTARTGAGGAASGAVSAFTAEDRAYFAECERAASPLRGVGHAGRTERVVEGWQRRAGGKGRHARGSLAR